MARGNGAVFIRRGEGWSRERRRDEGADNAQDDIFRWREGEGRRGGDGSGCEMKVGGGWWEVR